MSFLHLPRHCAALRPLNATWRLSSASVRRSPVCLLRPARTKPAPSLPPCGLRHSSTTAAKAFVYPEFLNVYRAGTLRTVVTGLTRIVTLVVFVLGAVVYSPSFYFSPDHSNLCVPAFMIGSAIPLLVVTLTSGPVVHAIRVRLPSYARRSRQDVKQFATRIPLDTTIEIHCIRLWPMPRPKDVTFGDLRRTQPSWKVGLSNLEHVPAIAKAHQGTLWGWLIHRWLGRFYVERGQPKDKSAAPGLWDDMWEQIPEAGSETKAATTAKERRAARPVAMANRLNRSTHLPAVKPPRPPRTSQ